MEKIVKEMEQFLNHEDETVRAAYVAGFRAANALHGYVTQDELDIENHIRRKILVCAAESYWSRREEAIVLLKQYGVDKARFRAMLFDCAAVSDAGEEVNIMTGQVVAPGEHEDYRLLGPTTDRYSEHGLEEVPYVPLKDENDVTVLKVHKNDKPFIDELLTQDIKIGDPVNERYKKEIQPGGMLEEHRDVITQALLEASEDRTCTCWHEMELGM